MQDDTVYILEANPRASRTVPLVSKVCNISMARIATQVMLGRKLKDLKIQRKQVKHFGVKEAVFPFNMFPEVDPILGPEMRSTGEVLGMADSFGLAFSKAEEAAGMKLPVSGTVLITVSKGDREKALEVAREFQKLGFNILSTEGCGRYFAEQGLQTETVFKIYQGRPHIIDRIKNNDINLIINTPSGRQSEYDDSYIRKAAVHYKIPYITTMAAAIATTKGIRAIAGGKREVRSLQEYHKGL